MPFFPVFAGIAAFAGLYAFSRQEEDDYGAVTLWMGGRGPNAGQGIAPWLGGRSVDSPYQYHNPSSVVTGWATNEVYGADDAVLETMGFIEGFFKKTFSRSGRLENLQRKITEASEKVKAYEDKAVNVDDMELLEKIAHKIASLEQNIDRWTGRKERLEAKGTDSFAGTGLDLEEEVLFTVALLSDQLEQHTKFLQKKMGSRKEEAALLSFLATYDALTQLVEDSLKASLSQVAKKSLQAQAGKADAKMAGLNLDPHGIEEARDVIDESNDLFGALVAFDLEEDDENEDFGSDFDDEDDEAFGQDDDLYAEGEIFGALPPSSTPSASSVLKSAGLASSGSWTQRNALQAGAADSMSRRLSGDASEADFAVLRAARPGIASSSSGPISDAWTGAPWSPDDVDADGALAEDDMDQIADAAIASMF